MLFDWPTGSDESVLERNPIYETRSFSNIPIDSKFQPKLSEINKYSAVDYTP